MYQQSKVQSELTLQRNDLFTWSDHTCNYSLDYEQSLFPLRDSQTKKQASGHENRGFRVET